MEDTTIQKDGYKLHRTTLRQSIFEIVIEVEVDNAYLDAEVEYATEDRFNSILQELKTLSTNFTVDGQLGEYDNIKNLSIPVNDYGEISGTLSEVSVTMIGTNGTTYDVELD